MTDEMIDKLIRDAWKKIEDERVEKMKAAGPTAEMTRREEVLTYKLAEPIKMTDNNRKRYVVDTIEIRRSVDFRGAGPFTQVRGHGHLVSPTTGKPFKKRDYMFIDATLARYFG